jgi:predicted Zn finger-like uncharacterized protein
MSMITSCPACGTMFRVVPDQLKISEGWVRCGHCSEVFDATAHLADEAALAAAIPQPSAPVPMPESSAPITAPDALIRGWQTTATSPLSTPGALTPPPPPPPSRAAPAAAARAPVADRTLSRSGEDSSLGPDSRSLEPSPLDTPFVFRRSDLAYADSVSSVMPPEPEHEVPLDEAGDLEPAALNRVSFVRQARRKALWRRPFVRIMLAMVSLLLAAVLVVQLAYQDRDRLALAEPALRPALEQMCELLHCTLGPPRQIDAVVIDSSGFNRVRSDTYRLAFTLRNTAPVPVAMPAMELTITDVQDQTVARRVITPAELGAGDALPPSAEWSRTIGLVLDSASGPRVAGYRLLAFYP